MKILCLSDLHMCDDFKDEKKEWIESLVRELEFDVVVITGDIFESSYKGNPYRSLAKMFKNTVVICTLGNHEFVKLTVDDVLKRYADKYQPEKYDVHYLDVVGYFDINYYGFVCRFLGNVLWYDGTMSTVFGQDVDDFAGGVWLDKLILGFDYKLECEKCVKQIKDNIGGSGIDKHILCSHTVPHYRLNGHLITGNNLFDAYSGVERLLDELPQIDYAICGHTHSRVVGVRIGETYGINCGNDSYPPFQYCLIEV